MMEKIKDPKAGWTKYRGRVRPPYGGYDNYNLFEITIPLEMPKRIDLLMY